MTKKTSYEELEKRVAFLENESSKRLRFEQFNCTLLKISNAINTSSSLDEFFKTLHAALSSVIDTNNFYIALYNPTNDSITFPYIVDSVDIFYPPGIEISKTESLTAEVIRTRNPLLITRAEILLRRSRSHLAIPTCTPSAIWLGVPLLSKEKILGVLAVQSYTDPQCYDQLDLDLLVSVADLVAIAIENKAAEESLKASERRFRTVVDLSVQGILLGSNEGMIIEANEYMCKLTGRTREEIIGKHISQISFTKESMVQAPFRFDLLKKGKIVVRERVLVRPDGSEVSVEMRTKMMPDGTYQSIFSDISERIQQEKALREVEERFRLAFITSPDCININKMDGTYVDINQGFTELIGYSREEVIGRSPVDMHIWDNPEDRQLFVEKLQRDGQVRSLEFRFRMKDGTKKIGLLSANIVTLSGEPHILAVTKDISHLKKIEKEKHDLEIKYMHSQKMEAIGIMAGGIAHDFNNMLAVIIGNAEMALLDIPEDNPGKHCVDQIILASQRVKELVKQILTFSRQADQKLQPVNSFSVIGESLRLLRSTIPTTVNIVHNFSTDNDTIMADVPQLHQLLMNLCTNAVHAMDEKGELEVAGVLVNLAAEDLAGQPGLQPGQYVKLSVSDTGCGIAEEIKDRIFDPFYTTKGVQEGTGMGLSIVLGIVESHGGFIQVNSAQGGGTTFAIYFPIIESEPMESGEKISEQYAPKNGRILFVDDEDMIATLGGSMLDHLGYKVTVKTSSIDALENFRSEPEAFDLVITDQSMPNMSGAELSMELLKIRPDIPIILCTGHSKKLTTEDAQRLGIKKYLNKPFEKRQLEKLIREILEE
jgi:PAS domain S-box-containing protein